MITFVTLRDVWSKLSQESLERVFSDWEMMIGFEAELTSEEIHIAADVAEVEQVMDCEKVVIATRIEGTCEGPIYFAFPSALAMEVVGEVLMIPEQARAAKVAEGLGESEIEAFREMANLLCGSSNMVFQALEKNLRISQSVDHLEVWGGQETENIMAAKIPDDRMVYIERGVVVGGTPFKIIQMLPFDVAFAITAAFEEPEAA